MLGKYLLTPFLVNLRIIVCLHTPVVSFYAPSRHRTSETVVFSAGKKKADIHQMSSNQRGVFTASVWVLSHVNSLTDREDGANKLSRLTT